MLRNKSVLLLFTIILGWMLAVPGEVYSITIDSGSIEIIAKITTHPDDYDTGLDLEMTVPVVCDLDADYVLEIVGGGYSPEEAASYLYIWNRDGTVVENWPIKVDGKLDQAPAVGDLDNDGDLEIVVSVALALPEEAGWVYAWHDDGSEVEGYPIELDFVPGPPLIGDIEAGFEQEVICKQEGTGVCLADIDMDGKKEVITAGSDGIGIENEDDIEFTDWPVDVIATGSPVAGDIDGDGTVEIFLAVKTAEGNFIYGWHSDGSSLEDWPVNIAGVVNTPGIFLGFGDLDGDGTAEIITGSYNGWIAAWRLDGSVYFSDKPLGAEEEVIYQPIVGDIDNDSDMEILAAAKSGNIYCYDHEGISVVDWSQKINFELSPGLVLVDIDQDSIGDPVNPVNDLELIFSGFDGKVHAMDLPGDFHPNDIQWGMSGFDSRDSGNYLRDWDTAGWFIFDDEPEGASINSVYDWNRGGRVIELDGAGLNNCYALLDPGGGYLNTTNTQFQWSMRYHLDFALYVSVDTTVGRRYLYYTPTEGDMLQEVDESGKFIHHGLGDVKDGKWHTFNRNLMQDLHDAYPDTDIIDCNALFFQGSGRVDNLMFIEGEPCAELENYAFSAQLVEVSTSEEDKYNINDGDTATLWVSDEEVSPWLQYSWDENSPLESINKITLEEINGATGGTIFITDADGNVFEVEFEIDSVNMEIVFPSVENVVNITIVFDSDGGSVSIGEIGVYDDPNYEDDDVIDPVYGGYIEIQNGYFWNPQLNQGSGGYWLPHGIAYQTWLKDLGQWQSPTQLRNDLDGMVEVGANAIRADFVWKHIEEEDDTFSWDNYDMLLEEAQARGLKVFPLIGYQWPPEWFPDEWYTKHPPCEAHPDGPWQSDILSYEHPDVRAEVVEYLQEVTSRYSVDGVREDLADTVAGWILGNEYGYLGLWSIEYDGYDDVCQTAFREWLEDIYDGDIETLNDQWANDNVATPGFLPGYPYANFSEVDMPIPFGVSGDVAGKYLARDKASWYDLTQWREQSIADYVAMTAAAVRDVDLGHLISYAAVGMQWGEEDWRYHTEDAGKITQACSDAGVPLDFWSINNYPWGLANDELMTGKWGLVRAQHDTGLPVMVTETGFTSTETMYPGIDEVRQGLLVRNAVWEVLESGGIGVCIFHWSDRDQFYLTEREVGFGVVDIDGNPKPAHTAVKQMFQQMEEINIHELLPLFIYSVRDIALLWTDAIDSIVNRYQVEMHNLFGTLERLGFNSGFINSEEMLAGDYADYKAIVLSRNQKMSSAVLDQLTAAALAGVKIHVNTDLPGIMDEYGVPRNSDPDWLFMIEDLLGIDTDLSNLEIDPDLEDDDHHSYGYYETASFSITYDAKPLYSSLLGYNNVVNMWKYRDEVVAGNGVVLAQFDSEDGASALIMNDYVGGLEYDTAFSLFSLGANKPIDNAGDGAVDWTWEDRYNWMSVIYTDSDYGFGLIPDLVITGSSLVLVDYRATEDLSQILLSFKNYSPDTTETVQVSSTMIIDKTVMDLLTGDLIEEKCDGSVEHELEPDGHSLFLAYGKGEEGESDGGGDDEETIDEDYEEEFDDNEEDEQDEEYDEDDEQDEEDDKPEDEQDEEDEENDEQDEEDSEDEEDQDDGQEDEQDSEDDDLEKKDIEKKDNTNKKKMQILNGTDDGEDGSGNWFNYGYGPASMLVKDADDDKEKNVIFSVGDTGDVSKKSYCFYRSYFGWELYPDEKTDLGKQDGVAPRIEPKRISRSAPREQFKQSMEEKSYQQPGLTRITPKKSTKKRKQEVMNKEDRVSAYSWAAGLLKWLGNFTAQLNSSNLKLVVKDSWSRLREGIQVAYKIKKTINKSV